jgi:hypothetical protein
MYGLSIQYKAYNVLANGFKAKGRPRRRWREEIMETLQQDLTII